MVTYSENVVILKISEEKTQSASRRILPYELHNDRVEAFTHATEIKSFREVLFKC